MITKNLVTHRFSVSKQQTYSLPLTHLNWGLHMYLAVEQTLCCILTQLQLEASSPWKRGPLFITLSCKSSLGNQHANECNARECDTGSLGEWLPTFQTIIMPLFARVMRSKNNNIIIIFLAFFFDLFTSDNEGTTMPLKCTEQPMQWQSITPQIFWILTNNAVRTSNLKDCTTTDNTLTAFTVKMNVVWYVIL